MIHSTTYLYILALIATLHSILLASGAAFPLADSDPDSPAFRRRFLASHGVNEAIEPKLTVKDRPLQEAIMPLIRTNPQKAIELIEEELTPDTNPAFLNILGNLYYQTSDYPNTEIYMLRALEKFPSLRRSWRTLALSYVQRGMMDQAIGPLIKVIELGGGDAQSYGLLAYAHLNEAHYESALSAYRMARMFDPNSFDFKRGQAMCLIKTEQLRSAIALFDELIVEKPNESTFWMAQANAFLSSEQTGKAIANLQMLSDAGTSTWESQRMLGDLYLNEDLSKLALDSYALGYRKHPPVATSQAVQPLIYLVGRRCFEEAQTFFQLIQSDIQGKLGLELQRQVNTALARIEMRLGDPEKAYAILTASVEEDPLDGNSLMLLGEYHFETQDYEESEYYFERATALRSFEADAYIFLGRLQVKQGNLKAALIPLREAQKVENTPNLQRYIESIESALDPRR
ncbi:tetratricopeptide repeat protein [Verrucomicrobia bacterium]|nr:tetratricopeptide repeat protein [Verrucomicrobiota bacterium]